MQAKARNQFQNSASQAERRRVLREEQASTYFERARVAEQLDSERSKSAVTGTKRTQDFPAIPSGPWSAGYWAQVPDEPPLGYAINEQEPVGEPAEVARSLEAMAPTSPMGSDTGSPSSVVERDVGAAPASDRPLRLRKLTK
jgi:hypothetical protein